jgi:hypothetical protein
LPQTQPQYEYHTEWESVAVLPIKSFDYWWNKQIKDKTRNMVRKAQKAGIEVRDASYDDAFVQGMTDIFMKHPCVRDGSSGITERISKPLSGNFPDFF